MLLVTLGLSVVTGLIHRTRDGRLRPARARGRRGPAGSPPRGAGTPTGSPSMVSTRTASTTRPDGGPAEPEDLRPVLVRLGHTPGERATLVQFSSAFCAPCRATRRILGEVSALVPGLAHVEIDAESQLALVRQLGILKTPTTLVLDAGGREVKRATGAPRKADVIAAVGSAVRSSP